MFWASLWNFGANHDAEVVMGLLPPESSEGGDPNMWRFLLMLSILFFPLSLVGAPNNGKCRPTTHLASFVFRNILKINQGGAKAKIYWHLRALMSK